MALIIFLILLYIFSSLSKFFFLYISRVENLTITISNFQKFTLIPFFSLIDYKDSKDKRSVIVELMSVVCGTLIYLSLSNLNLNAIDGLIYSLIVFVSLVYLLYLAVFDILTFSIPIKQTKQLIIFITLVNLISVFIRFIVFRINGEYLFAENFYHLGFWHNLVAGLAYYFGLRLLIYITKNEGMGEGDADIALFLGLFFGLPLSIVNFFITSIVGGIIAIMLALYLKKYKNVLVPFIPIILISTIITLGYGQLIFDKILSGTLF